MVFPASNHFSWRSKKINFDTRKDCSSAILGFQGRRFPPTDIHFVHVLIVFARFPTWKLFLRAWIFLRNASLEAFREFSKVCFKNHFFQGSRNSQKVLAESRATQKFNKFAPENTPLKGPPRKNPKNSEPSRTKWNPKEETQTQLTPWEKKILNRNRTRPHQNRNAAPRKQTAPNTNQTKPSRN